MSDVKAGQVWQHKNSGARVDVVRRFEEFSWIIRNHGVPDSQERNISEWLLTDDYLLVKDAP